MFLFHTKSLRTRINISIVLICLFLVALTLVTVVPYEKKRTVNRQKDIEALLNAVYQQKREALANELFAEQTTALKRSMEDMQAVNKITRIELFQLDGTFLLASDMKSTESLPEITQQNLLESPSFSLQKINDNSYAVFASLIEIIGEKVGFIRIYYDMREMERESNIAAFFLFSIFFILLIGGGFFTNMLLTRTIIKPTAKLSQAIRKVREGELGEQVHIESVDEMGSMAADFNDMSERLKKKHEDLIEAINEKDRYADKLTEINLKLEALNVELEKRVDDRTAELQKMYEQLRQEMSEKQQANEEKRQLQEKLARSQKMEALGLLAGGVAHDLNNVLSGIVSYPDLLLLQLDDDSPLKKPIYTIQKSGEKASAIVQDLLTLARRGVVTKDVININNIVLSYLESPEYHQVIKYHPGITVKTNLAEDLLPINGSSIHIAKTIMNLVSNAAEAQPDGGLIEITTANRYIDKPQQKYEWVDEGEYALLRVADKGSGIADEDLNRIFEPFYTKKVLGRSGTGLGMAVVWGAVQDHNGYIDVQSLIGEGSTFELFFPVTRHYSAKTTPLISTQSLNGNNEILLIVDDIAEQREITSAILKHLNYTAITAESGEAAIEYLRKNMVDLVILDMIMDPGIDGLDTYLQIQKIHPAQKAVIASGYAENSRVREALQQGVGAFVRKPFTLEKLGSVVQRALQRD